MKLSDVTIPVSVTEIETHAFASSGVATFKSQPNQTYLYTIYNSNGTIYKKSEVSVTNSNVSLTETIN
jgi:hypothetical protein